MKIHTAKLLLMFLMLTSISMAIAPATITVTPDSTNQYGKYTVDSGLQGFMPRVVQGQDSLVVIFDANTFVSSSITASLVKVNNVAATAVSVNGQRVSILSPVEIFNWFALAPFTIEISAAAKIRNPSTNGTYTSWVGAYNNAGNQINGADVSDSYSIYTSTSTVTAAAVTPNPSIASQTAAYTIGFDVGTGGFLTGGSSTITIGFNSATTIPNGSLSGVTVNGTVAVTTASNDTVVITSPVDIDNEGSITVNFPSGAGIQNPSNSGNYVLGVKTSSENTFVESDSFSISSATAFAISGITINDNTVNTNTQYAIDFQTSSSGALSANTDTLIMILPSNTYLPGSMSVSNVVISSGGFSDNAASIDINNNNILNNDTLFIVTPIAISGATSASITISNSSGILNPSEAGSYSLQLRTSQDTTPITSNPYQIVSPTTSISQATVTAGSNGTGDDTNYSVDFNLGSTGRLKPGTSTITISFHSDYILSTTLADYDNSTITVGGGSAVSIASNIAVNGDVVTVTVPSSVITSNSDNVVIFLDNNTGTDPIQNPGTSANYTLDVRTSVETTDVSSGSYAIGGSAITGLSVSLGDATVNGISSYNVSFTNTTALYNTLLGFIPVNDYITIVFPEGTILPSSIANTNVQVYDDGTPTNASSVSVSQATRTITVYVPQSPIAAGSTVQVAFAIGANIVNPIVPSDTYYKITTGTSTDIQPVTSSAYSITGDNTQVTSVSGSATPSVINATSVAFTANFTTSATGKLAGGTSAGSSSILLDFDTATIVPASVAAGAVQVNSNTCDSVSVVTSGSGGIVRVMVPGGVTIDNSSAVIVQIDTSAGLDNGSTVGSYDLYVRTSSDTNTTVSGSYSLTASQPLAVTLITPNPSTQNASAGYSVRFTTGSSGALSAGDTVRIIFPSNTQLPASAGTGDITVNGNELSANPAISGDTLKIPVPNAINNLTSVTILINQSTGIINPTLVQTYTLEVSTDSETGPYTSPSYNITQTTSTVSAADVTVETPTPSSTSAYTVDFNVGTNGRMLDGTSTFTITFDANTGVSTTIANYDNSTIAINEATAVSIASDIAVSGQEVIITIPTGVTIANNDQVTIVLDDNATSYPITNPSTSGDYTLEVRSSVETTDITSNSYPISSTSAVTNVSVSVAPDTVNAASTDTVSFTAQNALTAGVGTITVTFPFNTFVPSSITTTNIRIASAAGTPSSYSNASAISVNTSTRAVTITVLNDVTAGHNVSVAFLTGAGIENPSVSGSYTLQVRTSVQPLNGTSSSYTLQPTETTISGLSVSVDPVQPSVMGEYTYSFTTGSRGRLVSGTSTISLTFPDDISFTQGAPASSKVTVNSVQAESVTLNTGVAADTLVVTVPSSVTIGNNTGVTVVVDQTSGIQNASTTTSLTYNTITSVENTWLTGYDFSLPVELTLFETIQKEESVILNWVTESEIDNAYWIIERKEVSKEEHEKIQSKTLSANNTESEFKAIAEMDGQGNTSSQTEYSYFDEKVGYGKIYAYRLIDVSYTGVQTFHNIIIQEMSLPKEFELKQNYPNPFNPTTSIDFVLPKATKVSLVIYDIRGRKVAELLDQKDYEPGSWKVVWKGQNLHGEKVASGMYIYRIVADKFVKTKKMLLIR